MKRRNFIAKLSVLAPAAFAAPQYLFASSGSKGMTESAELLVIGDAEQNESLRTLISKQQMQAVYLGKDDAILKTERTVRGFRVYLHNRVVETKRVIVDIPVSVDTAAKKIRFAGISNDSAVSVCIKRREQAPLFRTLNRAKLNAADFELVTKATQPALFVLC